MSEPAPGFRKAAVWLGLAILACYAWSVQGSYHFDDSHSVEANIAIRSLSNIPSFWTDPRTSSFIPENRVYRPLVYTFYSICWLAGGGKPWPFHVMKLLMHWAVCLGIFFAWGRLWREKGWFPVKALKLCLPMSARVFSVTPSMAAFLLALLFAVHPAGSECVDYISATTSLQCAMFYVWAYCAYLSYRDSAAAGRPDRRRLVAALALYFLSVASKEEGVTLPAVVLVTELFLWPAVPVRERLRAAARRAFPFAVLGCALAAWIYVMHPESGNESRGFATWDSYFMTQWRAYLWYMRLWFWPWDLNADYATMEFSKSIADPEVIQAVIGNGLVIAFSWFNRKRFPAMLFGILWFYITISPASSVIKLAEAINEHRMYLAYVGFAGGTFTIALFCAESFFAAERRARRVGWLYALIAAGLVIGTQARNRVWADDESLWKDTVGKNPTSGRALNNLALVYLSRGEYAKSVELLERCEQYWASYMYCPLNRGISLRALGADADRRGEKAEAAAYYEKAQAALLRALSLSPSNVHANFHAGDFFEAIRKDCARALGYYRVAVDQTGGRYPLAEARMASCYSALDRPRDAVSAASHALEVEPGNQSAMFEKARAEYALHDLKEAGRAYGSLVRLNPGHLQGWYNLGVVELAANDLAAARRSFERTVSLDGRSAQGWYNLSYVAEKQGDGRAAVEAMKRLIELDPASPAFKSRLAELRRKFSALL